MKSFYHLLTTGITIIGLSGNYPLSAQDLTPRAQASLGRNYIHTLIPQTASDDDSAMIESIQYFDGLGRPSQAVSWQASPSGKDIVTPVHYDSFGRECRKYLPYAITGASIGAYAESDTTGQVSYYTGLYGSSDGPKAFSKTEFEASPLNRVLKKGASGLAWQPNPDPSIDHSVKMAYGTNSSEDTVRLWTVNSSGTTTSAATYPVNSLYKTTTWDENNQSSSTANRTEEFKDMQGKVVLKRSYNGTEKLSTYYVYDDLDLLRVVIPPLANGDGGSISSDVLSQLCYQYKYDERKRMIMRKIPGAESILMVYDTRDRLVLSQDGKARSAGKWMFTKYDCFNRPVMSGYFASGLSEEQLRTAFKNYTGTMYETAEGSGNIGYSFDNSYPSGLTIQIVDILSVTYYDNYTFLGVNGFTPVIYSGSYDIDTYTDNDGTNDGYFDDVKGLVTGTKMKVLDTNEFTSSAKWLYFANYYDNRYRVIQSRRTLYDGSTGGTETLANRYDFTGKITQNKLEQTFDQITTTVDKYLKYDTQGRFIKTEQQINGDANGKVTVAENVYNETGQLINKKLHKIGSNYLQNVDYAYNIRGWLNSINNPDNLADDLFGERLLYQAEESGLTGSTDVQFNGNISGMVWNSTLRDKQGYRFTYDALNRLKDGYYRYYSGGWINPSQKFEEKSITYDKNGNIKTLTRSDRDGNNSNYNYIYMGNGYSNRLSTINGYSYDYDPNGNTTTDGLRGMAIGYNVLNLPQSITKGQSITYIYSASGEKLAKKMANDTYQYYAGSMIYNDIKALDCFLFDEGVVYKSSGAYTYTYHLKDHLGNTRVAFKPNGGSTETTQVAEYYPFGENYSTLYNGSGTNNKYLYNGKEKQTDVLSNTHLDWYDYGARFYDPVIGRWHTIDPLAEKYMDWTPYNYVGNNPILRIDLFGLDWYTDIDGSNQYDPELNKKNSKDRLTDGQKYLGATYQEKNKNGDVTIDYRKDGSIVYANQTDAYNRMVNQGKKVDREQFGVITDNSVVVLPDYKNEKDEAYYKKYGYSFDNGKFVDKESGVKKEVVATAHTHPGGSTPSTYLITNFGDLGTAAFQTPNKMMVVFGLGNGTVSGLFGYLDNTGYPTGIPSSPNRTLNQILSGNDLRARLLYMNKVLKTRK